MRLLADQDVYAATVQYLRGLGLDVVTAAERGMSRSEDAELLRIARLRGGSFSHAIGTSAAWCSSGRWARASCTSGCFPRRWWPSTLSWGVSSHSTAKRNYSALSWSLNRVVIACGSRLRMWEMASNQDRWPVEKLRSQD